MRFGQVTFLTAIFWWASSGCGLSTYQTEGKLGDTGYQGKAFEARAKVQGEAPLRVCLEALRRSEVLNRWPSLVPSEFSVVVEEGATVGRLIEQVEIAAGWVYSVQTKAFAERLATHRVETPDPAGRSAPGSPRLSTDARPCYSLGVRFVRGGVTIDENALGGGGQFIEFRGSSTPGVATKFERLTERSFVKGVRDARGGSTVETDRQSVTAGFSFDGLVGLLPGAWCRLDGQINVTSFVGTGVDRVGVGVPLQLDVPRHQWIKVYSTYTADASMSLVYKSLGLSIGAGVDRVDVMVRVD